MGRHSGSYRVQVPARAKAATLDILVEPMGRVNFGSEVHGRKGGRGPVTLKLPNEEAREVTGWSVFNLALDGTTFGGLRFGSPELDVPAFWRGRFRVEKPGDTFLDLRLLGKGVVWLNSHCLGRFWNIGRTQTAYAPGPWLKPGENEVVVLDLLGPDKPQMAGLERPILDRLRPQLDFAPARRAEVTLHFEGIKPVHEGAFAPGV